MPVFAWSKGRVGWAGQVRSGRGLDSGAVCVVGVAHPAAVLQDLYAVGVMVMPRGCTPRPVLM